MADLKKGQRVRITYEATVISPLDGDGDLELKTTSGRYLYVKPEELEVIDDPATDPVGTVRRNGLGVYIRANHHGVTSPWLGISRGTSQECHAALRDRSQIIGVVPGSPADQS